MLGFFDESGDPGLKVGQGSSKYLVAALVTFVDEREALLCDQRISSLRDESGLSYSYEFHYGKNSRRYREAFLRTVAPYAFGYHAIVLDKDPSKLASAGMRSVNLYNHLIGLLFGMAQEHLSELAVVMDKRGSRKFKTEIAAYLRNTLQSTGREGLVRRLSVQESHRNNLLQLADYVASILNRVVEGDTYAINLHDQYLSRKRVTFDFWPK